MNRLYLYFSSQNGIMCKMWYCMSFLLKGITVILAILFYCVIVWRRMHYMKQKMTEWKYDEIISLVVTGSQICGDTEVNDLRRCCVAFEDLHLRPQCVGRRKKEKNVDPRCEFKLQEKQAPLGSWKWPSNVSFWIFAQDFYFVFSRFIHIWLNLTLPTTKLEGLIRSLWNLLNGIQELGQTVWIFPHTDLIK